MKTDLNCIIPTKVLQPPPIGVPTTGEDGKAGGILPPETKKRRSARVKRRLRRLLSTLAHLMDLSDGEPSEAILRAAVARLHSLSRPASSRAAVASACDNSTSRCGAARSPEHLRARPAAAAHAGAAPTAYGVGRDQCQGAQQVDAHQHVLARDDRAFRRMLWTHEGIQCHAAVDCLHPEQETVSAHQGQHQLLSSVAVCLQTVQRPTGTVADAVRPQYAPHVHGVPASSTEQQTPGLQGNSFGIAHAQRPFLAIPAHPPSAVQCAAMDVVWRQQGPSAHDLQPRTEQPPSGLHVLADLASARPAAGACTTLASHQRHRTCVVCGTSVTPKWRVAGTRCNACGLRSLRETVPVSGGVHM